MLSMVLNSAITGVELSRIIVVVGSRADMVRAFSEEALARLRAILQPGGLRVCTVFQELQLGTGHAVQMAARELSDSGITVILNGDVPLIQTDTISKLISRCDGVRPAILTVNLTDPTGYGRVIRRYETGEVLGIVEEKDCTEDQRQIHEVYTGMMAVPTSDLRRYLSMLTNDNSQNEFYLTDVIKHAVAEGRTIYNVWATHEEEVLGVNTAE